jgi:hypothetical protein
MHLLFLELIKPVPPNYPGQIEGAELSEIKAEAVRHNLLILFYSQLKKYQENSSPEKNIDTFLCEIELSYLKSIARSMQQEAVENELSSLLRKNSIPVIVIKGNEIAKEIYNDTNCRSSTDIDILCKREDTFTIHTLFLNAGYTSNIILPIKYSFYRLYQITYYSPKTHIPIEMHWHFGVPYFFRLTSEEIWDDVILTDSGQPRLSPEMIVIMLLIHHHSHSFRELKILVDILWALHKYKDDIDWYTFTNKMEKIGLIKTTQITLNQIQNLWKDSPDEILSIKTLEQAIQTSGHKPSALQRQTRITLCP